MNHYFTLPDPSVLKGLVPDHTFRLYYEPTAFFGQATMGIEGQGVPVDTVVDRPASWEFYDDSGFLNSGKLPGPLYFYETPNGQLEYTTDLTRVLTTSGPQPPLSIPVAGTTHGAQPIHVVKGDLPPFLARLVARAESIVSTSDRTFEVTHYRYLRTAHTLVYMGPTYTLTVEFYTTMLGKRRREVHVYESMGRGAREAINQVVGQ